MSLYLINSKIIKDPVSNLHAHDSLLHNTVANRT